MNPWHLKRKVASFKERVQAIGADLYAARLDQEMRDMRAARGATRKGLGSGWKTR